MKNLRAFADKLPKENLKVSQIDLGLVRYAMGMTKLCFLGMFQQYFKCVKEVSISTACEIKESKTIRKLALGEVVEVLETGLVDGATGIARLKCRTLTDKKEGWTSLRGNAGTSFFEKCTKPYYCFGEELPIQSGFENTSDVVKNMQPGEVLEVLEGPRKEDTLEMLRARGKAMKD